MVRPLWKTVWQFLNKLNIELPYNPAVPLLDIYQFKKNPIPRELKPYTHTKTCTQMFIAALFLIDRNGNNPSVHQLMSGLKRMWYIHTVRYYLSIKRNDILIHGIK